MNKTDLVIRGRRVVTENAVGPASVHISQGRIVGIAGFGEIPSGGEISEAGEDSIVMPGLVDTHVHVNEPGRAGWEGFETATKAAAAGGVTTIVDMPLNSIPATTTLEALQAKLESTRGRLQVDVGFWSGVVPGNTNELAKLWEGGVVGFKCFLIRSGVDEFSNVTESDLHEAMPELARLGATLIVHAELPGPIEAGCGSLSADDGASRSYETFLRSRPREAENEAVALLMLLSPGKGCRGHIVD